MGSHCAWLHGLWLLGCCGLAAVFCDGVTMDKQIIPAPTYPTKEEKLAHLVRLTADELSKTSKNPKKRRILVNQLQFFRRFWERENKGDE